MYPHPLFWALPKAHTPEGTAWIPGSIPLIKSFLTSEASKFMPFATPVLKTVIAASQTQNMTPFACNSFIPINTSPMPGTLNAPALGFQKGLRRAGLPVSGSFA